MIQLGFSQRLWRGIIKFLPMEDDMAFYIWALTHEGKRHQRVKIWLPRDWALRIYKILRDTDDPELIFMTQHERNTSGSSNG